MGHKLKIMRKYSVHYLQMDNGTNNWVTTFHKQGWELAGQRFLIGWGDIIHPLLN